MLVVVVTHQFSPLTLCWFSRVIRNAKDHEEHLDLCGGSPKHQVGKQKAKLCGLVSWCLHTHTSEGDHSDTRSDFGAVPRGPSSRGLEDPCGPFPTGDILRFSGSSSRQPPGSRPGIPCEIPMGPRGFFTGSLAPARRLGTPTQPGGPPARPLKRRLSSWPAPGGSEGGSPPLLPVCPRPAAMPRASGAGRQRRQRPARRHHRRRRRCAGAGAEQVAAGSGM